MMQKLFNIKKRLTNPEPTPQPTQIKTLPNSEAIKETELNHLRSYIQDTENHYKDIVSELTLQIEKLNTENSLLREEMREWVCEKCQDCFYGGSSMSLRQIFCPSCKVGTCLPKRLYKIKDLKNQVDKLLAEKSCQDTKKSA
jgi:hypothetical protein